jgi:hypothetical protein
MSWATLAYNDTAAAAGATNADFTAANDPDFTVRNGHYIFTEQYQLLRATTIETSAIRGRFQAPSWNAIGEFSTAQVNRSATVPSNYQSDWYGPLGPMIPMNEEFQVQVSNNLGAATEVGTVIIDIAPMNWNQNLPAVPPGSLSLITRASFTLTPTANVWSGGQQLTFSQALRGGVYAVTDCQVQGTNAAAWRLIFPRTKLYNGRKLRPGGLIQNAIGDVTPQVPPLGREFMGVLGYFHTFELPQVDIFGLTAGAITYQVFLNVTYLGQDLSILNNYVSMM